MKFFPLPPGMAYVNSRTISNTFFMGRWEDMIMVAVIAGLVLGMDMVLLIAATTTYIKRRQAYTGTPAFFILALIGGLNLLVLCVTQLNCIKTKIAISLPIWKHPGFDNPGFRLQSEPSETLNRAFGINKDFSSFRSHGYATSQVETTIPVIVDLMISTRLLSLFPDKKPVKSTGKLLMTVSGVNAFLSTGLRILLYTIGYMDANTTLPYILYIQHYLSELLSLGTNTFATWLLISKWRRAERLVKSYYATNRTNHTQRRLAFLITAGFLRGMGQLSYCVLSTVYGIISARMPLGAGPPLIFGLLLRLALPIEFGHYSISAIYPIASYVYLHAVHREEDICHLDLLNVQGDQAREIPLNDFSIHDHEITVSDHRPIETDSRHAD